MTATATVPQSRTAKTVATRTARLTATEARMAKRTAAAEKAAASARAALERAQARIVKTAAKLATVQAEAAALLAKQQAQLATAQQKDAEAQARAAAKQTAAPKPATVAGTVILPGGSTLPIDKPEAAVVKAILDGRQKGSIVGKAARRVLDALGLDDAANTAADGAETFRLSLQGRKRAVVFTVTDNGLTFAAAA